MAAAINPTEWNIPLGAKVPKLAGPILLAGLLLITGARVCLILLGLHRIRKLKARVIDPDDELSALFEKLCTTLKVRRPTALRVSTIHRSPLLLGFLHPVILLPAEQQPHEVAAVLRHELAHVNRRDDWANLAQHVVLSLLFFHPAARWVSKRLTLEREIACDDHVLQQGDGPRGYALLLANLAGRMQGCPPLLAPGASTNKSQLQQRIDMILDPNRNTSPRLSKSRLGYIVSSAMALAIAAIYCAPRIVFAQTQTSAAAAPATPAPGASVAQSAALPEAPTAPTPAYPPPVIAVGGTANEAVWTTPEAPDAPSPGAIPPGAKYKPGTVVTVRPGIMTTPEAPGVSSAVIVAPPIMTTPIQAFSEPRQPMPPRLARPSRNKGPDGGLEERLARLEQMVQSLVAQQNIKPGGGGGGGGFGGGGGGGQPQFYMKGPDVKWEARDMQRMQDYARSQSLPDQKELEKMKEMAEREARLAVDQAKRAARDGEKAAKDGLKWQFRYRKEASQKQLEGLRRQLEALEHQREMLDRQIEEIERSQGQLDDSNDEEQADVRPDKPTAEVAPKPAKK
jgi:beta-lactamase regulating signal transducer with metallopeptidase domain